MCVCVCDGERGVLGCLAWLQRLSCMAAKQDSRAESLNVHFQFRVYSATCRIL